MFFIVANWKMQGSKKFAAEYCDRLLSAKKIVFQQKEVVICPPSYLLGDVFSYLQNSQFFLGAQDCSPYGDGAYTGQISASMVSDGGAHYVIVGHSECRQFLGQKNDVIERKIVLAQQSGLTPILCVGEPLDVRQEGQEFEYVSRQLEGAIGSKVDLSHLIVAYEPIWAIGTGVAATDQDIRTMHNFIKHLDVFRGKNIRLLYGGSVKSSNIINVSRVEGVDGVLVGGASLSVDDFLYIIESVKPAQQS